MNLRFPIILHRRLLLIVLFCAFQSIIYAQLPIGYTASEIQNSYNSIMGVEFNADGTKMFVWEKRGHVYVSHWDGNQYVKQNDPVLNIADEVGDWRDFGMISFILDPDFESNGYVYTFYMVDREHLTELEDSDDPGGTNPSPYDVNDNDYFQATISRLTRYTINDLEADPLVVDYGTRLVLIGETHDTGVPLLHESHAGGALMFGDDGTLLVTTGDNASYSTVDTGSIGHTYYQQAIDDGILRPNNNVGAFRSQQLSSLCGKLLRIDPATGDGIPSNPFYDGGDPRSSESRIWATGLRNPFRASIQRGSGSTNPADANPGIVYVADVGWGTWEDLHVIDKPGLNAGWPLYEGLTQHNGYWNSGTTDPDENNELFRDNCIQPTSFVDDPIVANRRLTHNRPEVAWRHGGTNEARVPWFSGTTPTDPRIGSTGSPTTGNEFRGNTASGGVYIQGDAMGSSMNGKFWFSDYIRNWIQSATFTDGTLNWINDITEIAPINFGAGIVHLNQNPLNGFIYYTNIFNGTLYEISFEGPTWSNEPVDMTVECDGSADPGGAFNSWLNSFSGTVLCGDDTLSNNSTGLSDLCGATGSVSVTFTLSDECGNEITKDATFTIEDTINPTFNEALPGDVTVECDNIPSAATLTASDTCGTANVSFNQSSSPGACPNEEVITRTWTATDECGNEDIHIQTITVEDTTDPTWVNTPSDQTVGCGGAEVPSVLFNNWLNSFSGNDTCGEATVTNNNSYVIDDSCSALQEVEVRFTLTDKCGNAIQMEATFTVEETLSATDYMLNQVKLYPNPASTHIIVSGLHSEAKMEIFNLAGQNLMKHTAHNNQAIAIDLPYGLYILQLTTDSKKITRKLVVE